MLGDRIIESTFAHAIYYGAQLNAAERAAFCKRFKPHSPEAHRFSRILTSVDGERACVPYESWLHDETLGRERGPYGQIKEGLGR
jgi:hypothetical protein